MLNSREDNNIEAWRLCSVLTEVFIFCCCCVSGVCLCHRYSNQHSNNVCHNQVLRCNTQTFNKYLLLIFLGHDIQVRDITSLPNRSLRTFFRNWLIYQGIPIRGVSLMLLNPNLSKNVQYVIGNWEYEVPVRTAHISSNSEPPCDKARTSRTSHCPYILGFLESKFTGLYHSLPLAIKTCRCPTFKSEPRYSILRI